MLAADTTAQVSLTERAAQIVAAHKAAIGTARTVLDHARHAGDLLILAKAEVKAELRHGHWLRWLSENCDLKRRNAENYMQIARDWPQIQEQLNTHPNAHLGLMEALEGLRTGHWPWDDEDETDAASDAGELGPGGYEGSASDMVPQPGSVGHNDDSPRVIDPGAQIRRVQFAFTNRGWDQTRPLLRELAAHHGLSEADIICAALIAMHRRDIGAKEAA